MGSTRARFTFCPDDVTMVTNTHSVAVWWRNPLVDVIVSTPPTVVSQNTVPGGEFTTGVTRVLYKTISGDGVAAYCQFYVNVITLGLHYSAIGYYKQFTILFLLEPLCCTVPFDACHWWSSALTAGLYCRHRPCTYTAFNNVKLRKHTDCQWQVWCCKECILIGFMQENLGTARLRLVLGPVCTCWKNSLTGFTIAY